MFGKIITILLEENAGFDFRWQLARLFMAFIPPYTGGRLRTQIMRGFGFQVGRSTMIWDTPLLTGGINLRTKLCIGNYCLISLGSYWDLAAPIEIGNHVGVSPQITFLTGDHEISNSKNRVGRIKPRPIVVCDGVWLGARCTILPGVTIGEGAVVGACSLVTKDVPANVIVAGLPAKIVREL